MISSGARYAIRAMLYIAHHAYGTVTTREISERKKIPRVFLTKIIERLVHAGLLTSRRGFQGGVALALPAEKITLRKVIESIDGPLVDNPCLIRPEECECEEECPANLAWLSVYNKLIELMESHTIASMACIKEPVCPDNPLVSSGTSARQRRVRGVA
ncbi:MAG: Rrf2 family transcriptional regulator [Dehalococcoidia bacterium]|nr:Rrf2 family transcriptional regulator [Dehalococcoidia bacterium]